MHEQKALASLQFINSLFCENILVIGKIFYPLTLVSDLRIVNTVLKKMPAF